MVDGQKLLVVVANTTLKSPQLVAQCTVFLGHMSDIVLKGFDLPCISTEATTLSSNDAMGVMLQLEQVLGISHHVHQTSMVVVLEDVAHLINTCHTLRIRVVLDRV
jgi:hypothetical protein